MPLALILLIVAFIFSSLVAFYFRKNKSGIILKWISCFSFLIILAEFTCSVGLYFKSGGWIYSLKPHPNFILFQPHPYLVAVGRKNATLTVNGKTITHNSKGFRGKEFTIEKNKFRIAAIGGSTTYGVNVNDNQTWCYYLDSLQQGEKEVLNFGVPGYTTVEMLIQSQLIVQDYKPDVVLIHVGLNDLRNYNVANLETDYSNFHAPSFYGNMGFCFNRQLPRSGLLLTTVLVMQKMKWYPLCKYHQMHAEARKENSTDSTSLRIYKRNLHSLISLYKNKKVSLILIPQVLNDDVVKNSNLKKWIQFIPENKITEVMKIYNQILKKVAEDENVLFADEVLKQEWKASDFVDHSHLNATANKRFAGIINSYLKTLK